MYVSCMDSSCFTSSPPWPVELFATSKQSHSLAICFDGLRGKGTMWGWVLSTIVEGLWGRHMSNALVCLPRWWRLATMSWCWRTGLFQTSDSAICQTKKNNPNWWLLVGHAKFSHIYIYISWFCGILVLSGSNHVQLLQDMLVAYLHNTDVHALRNNPGKNFFDLKGCADPASAQAVEQNYKFVLQLTATMAGAPSYPPAGKFKARPSEKKIIDFGHIIFVCSVGHLSLYRFRWWDIPGQDVFYKLATIYYHICLHHWTSLLVSV